MSCVVNIFSSLSLQIVGLRASGRGCNLSIVRPISEGEEGLKRYVKSSFCESRKRLFCMQVGGVKALQAALKIQLA